MKIDHFAFEVSNLPAAIDFYVTKLGFELLVTFTDENEHETLAVLGRDGGKLELIQVLDEANQPQPFVPSPIRPHFCPHLALETDDFERTLAEIEQHELKIVHGPLEIPGTAKWLYIMDLDQNVIEFFQDFQAPD